MTTKLQRYKLVIIRQSDGTWTVSGYREMAATNPMYNEWDQDGGIRHFSSRQEALQFCMIQEGIPG